MRDDLAMRTTLDIDKDVLETAKELAARRGTSAGRVLSDLARSALAPRERTSRKRNGAAFAATETCRTSHTGGRKSPAG